VARRIDPAANRAHIDIGVDDVDAAIAQIERIAGRLKGVPSPAALVASIEQCR
jgi:hypothetical protein